MTRAPISIAEWQKRLEDNFLKDDQLAAKGRAIASSEVNACNLFEQKYVGHSRLSDACILFSLDTLQKSSLMREVGKEAHLLSGQVAIDLMMMLRKLRASAILVGHGYQGPAFSLLRDIKDKSVLLSAYFQGQANYAEIAGVDNQLPAKATRAEIRNRTRRVRINAEKAVFDKMFDFSDFIDPTHRDHLKIWQDTFDMENHGSAVSASSATKTWQLGSSPLNLINSDDETLEQIYMNRFCDVAWMFHRLLPNLQTEAQQFDDAWKSRWKTLDHSLWMMQNGLAEIGRPIGTAIIQFVDRRFPFNSDTHFSRR